MGSAVGIHLSDVRRVALALFHERGYENTSMRDIAAALGVRKASLYHHVESKQELLLAAALDAGELLLRTQAEIARRLDLKPMERARRMFEGHVEVVASHQALVHALVRERRSLGPNARARLDAVRQAYEGAWRSVLEQAKERGQLRAGLDVRTALLGLLGMADWVVEWYRPDGRLTAHEVASSLADLALWGISAPYAPPD